MNNKAIFQPYSINESELNNLPINDGQFIVTDTNKIYVDLNGTRRSLITASGGGTVGGDLDSKIGDIQTALDIILAANTEYIEESESDMIAISAQLRNIIE